MLVGCGSAPQTDETTPADTIETPAATETEPVETEPETTPLEIVPVENFDGYEYRILAQNVHYSKVRVEELNGEQVNDADWTANNTVEDRYNMVLPQLLT